MAMRCLARLCRVMHKYSKGNSMLILLEEIEWDENLYPRVQVDWKTEYEYSDAMKAGDVFPQSRWSRKTGNISALMDGTGGAQPSVWAGKKSRRRSSRSFRRSGSSTLSPATSNMAGAFQLSRRSRLRNGYVKTSVFLWVESRAFWRCRS